MKQSFKNRRASDYSTESYSENMQAINNYKNSVWKNISIVPTASVDISEQPPANKLRSKASTPKNQSPKNKGSFKANTRL